MQKEANMAKPKKTADVELPTVVEIADAAAARAYLREHVNAIGVDELSDEDAISRANAHQKEVQDAAFAAAAAKAEAAAATKAPPPPPEEPAAEAAAGTVRLTHPGGATSAGWDGHVFTPDAKGVFTVPIGALADLTSHGFVRAK